MGENAKNLEQVRTSKELAEHDAIITALSNSIYPGAKPESVLMVIKYCEQNDLDPFTKPVHIVPMSVKNDQGEYRMRDVIMPGIELYRTKAARTGKYAGLDQAEFGQTITETFDGVPLSYPEWCSITVYKMLGDQKISFSSGRVRFKEIYATASRKTDAPNSMWKKRPFGQLEKCAEALALRRAFPEAIGNELTADEMAGKVIDSTAEVVEDESQSRTIEPDSVESARPKEKPTLTDEEFTPKLVKIKEWILAGKGSHDDAVKRLQQNNTLSQSQIDIINEIKKQ